MHSGSLVRNFVAKVLDFPLYVSLFCEISAFQSKKSVLKRLNVDIVPVEKKWEKCP